MKAQLKVLQFVRELDKHWKGYCDTKEGLGYVKSWTFRPYTDLEKGLTIPLNAEANDVEYTEYLKVFAQVGWAKKEEGPGAGVYRMGDGSYYSLVGSGAAGACEAVQVEFVSSLVKRYSSGGFVEEAPGTDVKSAK